VGARPLTAPRDRARRCGCFALLAAGLLLAASRTEAQIVRTPVILDTDIGTDIDDAWALGFVASFDGFEPLGVTVTDGDTASRGRLACKLLGRTKHGLPVAVGRATPVPPDRVDREFQWAEEYAATRPVVTPAADFIAETVRARPGEVVLIAVGPLQNVADALRKEPRLPKLVRRLVLMSGCVYGMAGVDHPIAEWNVKQAIADAQLVYGAGFPLTIAPLDATTLVRLDETERARVRASRLPLPIALESLYRLWLDGPTSRMTLHDQLAVAEAAKPGAYFAEMPTLSIRVDDEGYTRIDPSGRPVSVCLKPRRDLLVGDYLDTLLGR
jgi:inosine-uridine nucleoside N-ribohydrolase